MNLKYLHGYKGTWGTEFWNALGNAAQYILADGFWSENYPYPMAKEIGERYYQNFHKRSVSIGLFYAISQTLFKAPYGQIVVDVEQVFVLYSCE